MGERVIWYVFNTLAFSSERIQRDSVVFPSVIICPSMQHRYNTADHQVWHIWMCVAYISRCGMYERLSLWWSSWGGGEGFVHHYEIRQTDNPDYGQVSHWWYNWAPCNTDKLNTADPRAYRVARFFVARHKALEVKAHKYIGKWSMHNAWIGLKQDKTIHALITGQVAGYVPWKIKKNSKNNYTWDGVTFLERKLS